MRETLVCLLLLPSELLQQFQLYIYIFTTLPGYISKFIVVEYILRKKIHVGGMLHKTRPPRSIPPWASIRERAWGQG